MAMESDAAESLRARIETFVARNFPQIALHGGTAGVEGVSLDAGEVWIALGGACTGCGISPLTERALSTRLRAEFDAIDVVHVDAGDGPTPPTDDFSDVPF